MLPLAGMSYSFTQILKRMGLGAWSWSGESPLRRSLIVACTAGIAAVSVYVLLPNGEYRPIQPNERGTLQGGIAQLAEIPSGRPALTEEREDELGGAPTVRSGGAPNPAEDEEEPATPTSTEPGTTTGGTSTEPASTTPASTTPTETTTTLTETVTTPTETSTTPSETTTTPTETTP